MADKPYPWTCGNCAQKKVEPVIGDYTVQHDIFLSQVAIPTCQNCGTVQTGTEIGDKVTKALRDKVDLLLPKSQKDNRFGGLKESIEDIENRINQSGENMFVSVLILDLKDILIAARSVLYKVNEEEESIK